MTPRSYGAAPESLQQWQKRFLATDVSLPTWAADQPERLLYAADSGGRYNFYAWDRLIGSHRRITRRAEGTLMARIDPTGNWVWWLDDDAGNEWGVWVIVPFDPDSHDRWSPDLPPAYAAGLALGRNVAVVGTTTRERGTRIYRVERGRRSRLLYAHRRPADVAALSCDDTLVAIADSEGGDSRHRGFKVLDLEGITVARLRDGHGRGFVVTGFSPIPGDPRLLVRHERADQPRPLIFDPTTGEVTDIETSLKAFVDARWFPDGKSLLLLHHERGRTGLYRYALDTRTLERLEMDRGTVTDARVRPDGSIWYAWSRARTPTEIREGNRIVLTVAGEPAPTGVPYSHHDVEGIHVLVARPEAGEGPYPAVFKLHGGPAFQDRDEFSPEVQAWVEAGYAVVMVNYRGSGGYGRAWRDALVDNPGFTELEDVAHVRQWAVSERLADPDRLVLTGESWGGFLTLLGLGTQPHLWTVGIAAVPMADPVATYDSVMEPIRSMDRALFGGSPREIPERYRERSPMTYVDRLVAPVLILAGRNDPRCPLPQVQNYVERLQEIGHPHRVYYYDSGHEPLVKAERARQMRYKLLFAKTALSSDKPPARPSARPVREATHFHTVSPLARK